MLPKPHRAPPKRRTDHLAQMNRIGLEADLRLMNQYRRMMRHGIALSHETQALVMAELQKPIRLERMN